MLIKIRYPIYVSVLISFVFCSWIINEFEIYYFITVFLGPELREEYSRDYKLFISFVLQ